MVMVHSFLYVYQRVLQPACVHRSLTLRWSFWAAILRSHRSPPGWPTIEVLDEKWLRSYVASHDTSWNIMKYHVWNVMKYHDISSNSWKNPSDIPSVRASTRRWPQWSWIFSCHPTRIFTGEFNLTCNTHRSWVVHHPSFQCDRHSMMWKSPQLRPSTGITSQNYPFIEWHGMIILFKTIYTHL